MVREREPPRPIGETIPPSASGPLHRPPPQASQAPQVPLQERTNVPQQQRLQFGVASPLRNPLQNKQKATSVFNAPKPGQVRPEHHRTTPPNPPYKRPIILDTPSPDASIIEIPRPVNMVPVSTAARPQPMFSSSRNTTGFQPANAFKKPQASIDSTRRDKNDEDDSDGEFNPDKALNEDKFGAFDPQNYMDAVQANDNIKALLEGAFEDDDDKPKTRGRKKKQEAAAAALADKLGSLNIDGKQESQDATEEEDDGTVEGLTVKLLPHQIDGMTWMLDKEIGQRKKNGVLPRGGILADDMGLGKTIQALSLILSNPRPSADDLAKDKNRKIPEAAGKGTLVVAPLALIKQWESEIRTKVDTFPKIKVLVHHGTTRTKRFEDLKRYDVVITTYQTLTSEHEGSSDSDQGLKVGCFGVHWYRVILDEAHSIKNRNAKMTKAAYALKSVYRWCLTGTPMQNNLDELQSLIRFLRIKPYNDMQTWKEQIIQPMKNGKGGLAMKRLQFFLKAFMKRRTKEVLKREGGLNFGKATQTNGEAKNGGFKIVARNVETIVAEFDDSERQLYDRLMARTEKSLEDMMGSSKHDYIGALVLLLRLRQTCNHPELIRGNLRKEKDALSAGSQSSAGQPTPRKGSSATETLDDIADMFGALTVQTKKCDVCQSTLEKSEIAAGAIRCSDCETDLDHHRRRSKEHKHKIKSDKKHRSIKGHTTPQQPVRRRHMKRVVDSDDEEDDGEWIVPTSQQDREDLGKAGGTDDEDAEGGGDWLGSEDSDTEDESNAGRQKSSSRKHRNRAAEMDSFIEHDDSYAQSDSDSSDESSLLPQAKSSGLIASTKIRRLVEILREHSAQHKFIVFSEFTSMLDLVEPFLLREGFRFTRYDGSMKNDDREASLERLRNDPRTRILLCSLRCGSLGLNLTAASRVVILEPFWNPFVEEQAIDRVHRLNQTRDVTVYRLTIANTVEERILDLQEKKRELAAAAIDGGKAVGKLSMKDILSLFRHDAEHDARHDDRGEKTPGFALGQGRSMGLLEPLFQSPRKGEAAIGGTRIWTEDQKMGKTDLPPGSSVAGSRPGGSTGAGVGEKPKFMVPPTLKSQFGEAYARRW